MRLYEELFKIDERVLYYDTDSIIFISKENHYEPELAYYLGKFTNEINWGVVESHTTNGKNHTKNGEKHRKNKFVNEIDKKFLFKKKSHKST